MGWASRSSTASCAWTTTGTWPSLVQAVLTDEGYAVSCIYSLDNDALLRTVGRLEPDCILLDSDSPSAYGTSWELAADVAERHRPVPVVMFSAHVRATEEAERGASERAVHAAAEAQRTDALVKALRARGATDIHPSVLREWALFRDRRGALIQLYWWQGRGVYQVGRYNDDGTLRMLGQFVARDAAIEVALPS